MANGKHANGLSCPSASSPRLLTVTPPSTRSISLQSATRALLLHEQTTRRKKERKKTEGQPTSQMQLLCNVSISAADAASYMYTPCVLDQACATVKADRTYLYTFGYLHAICRHDVGEAQGGSQRGKETGVSHARVELLLIG